MGAFILLRQDRLQREEALEQRILTCFRRQGFARPTRFVTPHWTLFTFPKYSGQPAALYERAPDSFATCTGTLLFKGTTASKALELLFDTFEDGAIPWDEVSGNFCMILFSKGKLFLLPDRLGVYKVYRDESGTVISSSFLAVLESISQPRANRQSIFEYVFHGATYGGRTIIEQIRVLEQNAIFILGRDIQTRRLPKDLSAGVKWSNVKDHLALVHHVLCRNFRGIAASFGDKTDTALTGGYDSRLALALLREQGVSPRVHVYGGPTNEDVRRAMAIAAGEGFSIKHVNKSAGMMPSPDAWPAIISQNFLCFDGYPLDGIFNNGADRKTRADRAADGALILNGGGGEIFRNFIHLPDRSFSMRQVLSAYFYQFDSTICTSAFVEEECLRNLAVAIVDLLDVAAAGNLLDGVRLPRHDIEYLYPYFRCAFWMGRNNSVNNRFGFAHTPFIDAEVVRLALQIPIRFKTHGQFESALICAADPALARYPSIYGHGFDKDVALARRLKGWLTLSRPIFTRRWPYRIRTRLARSRTSPAIMAPLAGIVDPSFPEVRQYFKIEKVARSSELINRIATLEYLFEKYSVSH